MRTTNSTPSTFGHYFIKGWINRKLLSHIYPYSHAGLHPPRGRVEGEERAFGEGGWRLDRCSNHPPRKLAYARFRPSQGEGEVSFATFSSHGSAGVAINRFSGSGSPNRPQSVKCNGHSQPHYGDNKHFVRGLQVRKTVELPFRSVDNRRCFSVTPLDQPANRKICGEEPAQVKAKQGKRLCSVIHYSVLTLRTSKRTRFENPSFVAARQKPHSNPCRPATPQRPPYASAGLGRAYSE